MKFARYLEETQIPEWKKVYIDYRGLKKRITAIRRAQERDSEASLLPVSPVVDESESGDATQNELLAPRTSFLEGHTRISGESGNEGDASNESSPPLSGSLTPREPQDIADSSPPATDEHDPTDSATITKEDTHDPFLNVPKAKSVNAMSIPDLPKREGSTPGPSLFHGATINMGFLPRLKRRSTVRNYWEPSRRAGKSSLQWDLAKSIPLKDLLPLLSPVQRAFFEKLDSEFDKIEAFFVEREKEMRTRTTTLKAQLQELKDHKRAFQEAQSIAPSWLPASLIRRKPTSDPSGTAQTLPRKRRSYKADTGSPMRRRSLVSENKALEEGVENVGPRDIDRLQSGDGTLVNGLINGGGSGSGGSGGDDHERTVGWKRLQHSFQKHNLVKTASAPHTPLLGVTFKHDPEDYQQAKKKLKKAVLECYRGLEVLENYRTLNLIGFRKALKKFEKCTKIPAQQAYFVEKIEPSAFSSGAPVQAMLSEMEKLYASHFTRGDNKLAKARLRGAEQHKTHHFSTFRTGILLGLALPAFVDAIYLSFQPDTQQAMPGYAGIFYIYSIFLVPVIFSLLVGLNVLAWSRSRINYVFIFELDLKTKLDHREYFEIPALLLSTLCYAFWLSFAQVGTSHFSPTLWPLVWLAFAAAVMLNPIPVLFKPSRWWLARNIGRLLTSGMHRVEFADFWMGDQFCSLIFPLSNLYFVACAYTRGFDNDSDWQQCLVTKDWGVPFVLASIPLLVRLVQSIKRWVDSRLITHLINGGKYGSGIIYYLFYFNWRHRGGVQGASFALWCLFGTIYATYASAWDLLMDWSVLRPHATYPFLRSELLYGSSIPLYYIAIVTNVLIRFIWVFYIPVQGPNFMIRTFIAGMLEILRRLQWNFFRLENEHLGNMDQYRVTREVPLPYSFDDAGHESDADEDDHQSVSSWRRRKTQKPQTRENSRGDGERQPKE